jgi:hypothetical protein
MRLRFGFLSAFCDEEMEEYEVHVRHAGDVCKLRGHRLHALQDLLVLVAQVVSFGLLGVFGRNGWFCREADVERVGTPSLDTVA